MHVFSQSFCFLSWALPWHAMHFYSRVTQLFSRWEALHADISIMLRPLLITISIRCEWRSDRAAPVRMPCCFLTVGVAFFCFKAAWEVLFTPKNKELSQPDTMSRASPLPRESSLQAVLFTCSKKSGFHEMYTAGVCWSLGSPCQLQSEFILCCL